MNDGATMKTIVGWPVNEIWALTLNVDLEDHQDILSDNQRDDIGPRLVVLQDVKWWLISRVDGDFTRVSFGKSSEYPDPSSNQYVQTSNPRQRKTTQTTKETKETNNACLMDDHDFPLLTCRSLGQKNKCVQWMFRQIQQRTGSK